MVVHYALIGCDYSALTNLFTIKRQFHLYGWFEFLVEGGGDYLGLPSRPILVFTLIVEEIKDYSWYDTV